MGWLDKIFKKSRSRAKSAQLVTQPPKRIMIARLPSRFIVDDDAAVSVAQTYGLIRFTVHEVTLTQAVKGRDYFATVSIGRQTVHTPDVAAHSPEVATLSYNAGSSFVLQRDGATVARVAVFRQGRLEGAWSNTLVGVAEVDLRAFFSAAAAAEKNVLTTNASGKPPSGAAATEQPKSDDAGVADAAAVAASAGVVLEELLELVDPEDSSKTVGSVRVSGQAASLGDLERQTFAALFLLADFDGDGALSEGELAILLNAFGSDLSDDEIHDLFIAADADESGTVDVEELSRLLALADGTSSEDSEDSAAVLDVLDAVEAAAVAKELGGGDRKVKPGERGELALFSRLVKRCPVDGAALDPAPAAQVSNLLYVWLALSAARANHEADMAAGYLTEAQAAQSWMLRLSEWASHPTVTRAGAKARRRRAYTAGGLRVGSAAAHILVYDRADRRVVEEALSPVLNLALRKLYQSAVGRVLLKRKGMAARLKTLSVREGNFRDSPESAKEIGPFVESFRGQIDVEDAELPLDQYKTFNEFFYRKLKPGARPIAEPECPDVITSAADCRLQVFSSVDAATRFWIKGRNFSVAGLLGDTDPGRPLASAFSGGTMAIFRLAPQDYHRYHTPAGGRVLSITDIPGDLLTVNPVAVNSVFCDVFTVNKRSVLLLETEAFGTIAFVAIGATLVGSIVWSVAPGDTVAKGDELGYFKFGGSSCIVLFPDAAPVMWDADLAANAERSLETLVRVGERIGVRAGSALEERPSVREAALAEVATAAIAAGAVPLERRPELRRIMSGEEEDLPSVALPLEEGEEESESEAGNGGAKAP